MPLGVTMSDLQLTHTASGDGSCLQINAAGRLCIDTAAELQQFLLAQTMQSTTVKLDLSAIDAIDLAGIQVICSACRTFLNNHKPFNLTGSPSSAVTSAKEALGLQRQSICKHNNNQSCIWCGGLN